VIEAAYGLGAAVVNGEVTPDRFCVDKATLQVRSRSNGLKNVAYRYDPVVGGTRRMEVARQLQAKPCVSDDEIVKLAELGKQIEQAMGCPQDIEWAIDAERQLFMLQARPETVWSQQVG
jgi:pyruvate,water dikinase